MDTAKVGRVDDLSALAWVHVELRRSLETAHKALRRFLRESEAAAGSDVDAVDPAVLRTARSHLHQGVGALELVGLPAVADVLRAGEAAVQRLVARPALVNLAAVETVEHLSFALLDFLGRQLAGKPVSPVMLFPQYRDAQQLARAERIHPADLWRIDWQWLELPADASAQPRQAGDEARSAMEALVLTLMREPSRSALAHMSDLCADLGAGARAGHGAGGAHLATFWQLAAAVFEAQAVGLLASDVHTKRIASRLLAQLRTSMRGEHEISDRLAQDLLFFCSHARPPQAEHPAPRLAAVRRAWRLDEHPTADYEAAKLGRFDPATVSQARKRVAAAKDAWSAVAGEELHRLSGLAEQFALVGNSLQRLLPAGNVLAQALETAVAQTVAAGAAPPAALAMEVATGMLYVDATLEDGELDHPELAARVQHLARRIDSVRSGAEPQPLEIWMEELYRRVSDRQTMGSVVQELRASLSEVEKQIDQYFRDPARRELLIPVPAQLSAMRGVFSVMGLGQASQAVLHMRDAVDQLAQTEVDPQRAIQTGTFDRLADNLGALSFLIDMISVQPALAKSLFRFDAASGSLSAVMGQPERVSAFVDLDLTPAPTPQAEPAAAEAPPLPMPAEAASTGMEDNAELREIFIEEAREVIADARGALERLADTPDSAGDMTIVRRVFHTLKGSSRMVGLPEFGAAAWACEQLFNDRLAHAPLMDQPLRLFSGDVLDYLGGWVEAIAGGRDGGHGATAVAAAAASLRLDGVRLPLESPRSAGVAEAAAAPAPAAEPGRTWDTTITLPPPTQAPAPAASGLDFEFDLGDEAEATPTPAAAESLTLRVPDLPSAADLDFGLLDLDLQAAAAPAAAPADAAPLPPPAPSTTDGVDFDLDLDLDVAVGLAGDRDLARLSDPAVPRAPAPADAGVDLPPLGLLDLPLDAPPPDSRAGELPAPEVQTLEMDAGLADLMFPLLDDTAPSPSAPAPSSAPATDLEWAAPPAGVEPADAPAAIEALATEPADAALPAAADEIAAAAPEIPGVEPAADDAQASEDEQVKVIGPLRIGIPLFNIYLNEADELSRRLGIQLAEWALEHERHPVPETSVALAHSMAGSSATVGYSELSALARALEHALMRSHAAGHGRAGEPELFTEAAEEIRRLLHQFAAGFLRPVAPELMERLALHERLAPEPAPAAGAESAFDLLAEPAAAAAAALPEDDIDAVDAVDTELFPIFEDEADELLPQLQSRLRDWLERPGALDAASACLRTLHTFKGGARLAGAMRLGEMAHRLETAIESLAARGAVSAADVEPLLGRADAMASVFDTLRLPAAVPPAEAAAEARIEPAAAVAAAAAPAPVAQAAAPAAEEAVAGAAAAIDWQRLAAAEAAAEGPAETAAERPAAGAVVVRVRAALLDRLVNSAGEVSITRARMDADVRQLQAWLAELSDSLDRMRRQLRDIELQAETQIGSRIEAAKVASLTFDPLEMDRFTRFQELTRFMAESVNDVATLQRSLQRTLQSTEDELAAQARLTRELQDDLLRTRMVEFESMSDRLYRTVRQAGKDAGRQVRLDIEGGAIEIDRGVLERMTGPFEHLLRNAVAHGIETPAQREQAGKDASGRITIAVAQAGNEVAVEISDDGAGLDLQRIRQRALERGLVAPQQAATDAELAQLIFSPGFSTFDSVTELAGRGVGLDVVRAEVNAMGGRIETASQPGQGTRFKLLLPLTTAVTQVVMLRCADQQVAVPSTLIDVVRRVPAAEVERAYAEGLIDHEGQTLPFFWLSALLHAGNRGVGDGRAQAVVIIRSAAQRVAVHVEEVVGNQEVVVKNIGPQLARLPGLVGVTLLPSGTVALIYNPVALASVYAESARALMRSGAAAADAQAPAAAPARTPMVMVVDDSLTVRRVTQRLLVREGWRVVLAKDGLEALERLAEERPVVLLTDIEMPRMDGFDLVRNVRADPRLADLPVVMITSRIAQKHRDYAAELGVQHYLGKPYSEEELLSLVAQYAGAAVPDILT